MIDVAALRKLLAETTQGVWIACPRSRVFKTVEVDRITQSDYVSSFNTQLTEAQGNVEFSAAAHNAMPALLDELDAARSEILTLCTRLGNIADLTTMPMPEDWTKR